jgi:putative ABC transport system permease protein
MATVLLIYLFISREQSYDRFHERGDRIYRVYQTGNGADAKGAAYVPPVLARTLAEELPEVEAAVRLLDLGHTSRPIIRYRDKSFNEERVFLADSNFARVFTVRFLKGNPATALLSPRSIVFTAETAKKYFGPAEPMGKTVQIEGDAFTVTGVVDAFPAESHFRFDVLISMSSSKASRSTWWLDNAYLTYLLLRKDARVDRLQPKIDSITHKHMNPQYQFVMKKTFSQLVKEGRGFQYALQPLAAIHLHSAHIFDFTPQGNIAYVYLFAGIGLAILLIACFNYINLTTANAARRAREVGIRKVMGAGTSQLVRLFLTESFLTAGLATLLSFTIVQATVALPFPILNRFLSPDVLRPDVSGIGLGLLLFAGLVSGLAPALYITAYQPVKVLKGQLLTGNKGAGLRNVLVVAQFAVSTGLIMYTLLVQEQLSFMQNRHLGFHKENVIVLNNVDQFGTGRAALKNSLTREAFVASAAYCYNVLGNPYNWYAFTPVGDQGRPVPKGHSIPRYMGDNDFLETLQIELVMGHDFPPGLPDARRQIMLNREAIRRIGWAGRPEEQVIGKQIDVNGVRYELAAVIEDFNFLSLKDSIGPAAIVSHHPELAFDHLMIRIKPGDAGSMIGTIEKHWKAAAPGVPFSYSFLDEDLNRLYQPERQVAGIFNLFSGLAILIACLGLLGLALFTAERRTREVGIRKVLGATLADLLLLLNEDFVRLVLLASVLACPAAYWAMQQWLRGYAFRVEIGLWLFLLPTAAILVVALLTVSALTWRSARANPVKSLQTE